MNKPQSKDSFLPFIFCLLVDLGAIFWLNTTQAVAQITPDATLPNNSVVLTNGNTIEITGGTTQGQNLFHSFQEFSLNTGNTAFFDNAIDIGNIVTRVTGGSVSNIDGLIRANGTANLFFVNPSGIVFDNNAALDIGGSFIGSTANSLKFADGSEFSAVTPEEPMLTVSIPVGLQYGGTNSGDITVKDSGNNLFIDFNTYTVDRSDRPVGLGVEPEQTLALVGGNVFLEGGNLTAAQGNIELGSVAGTGLVKLATDDLGWRLNYEQVSNFQEIALSEAASLEASGSSGGRVRVKGGFVSLADGSAILTDTLGDGTGGSLTIEAEETEIYGVADNGFTSSLFTNVHLGATGKGGDLLIDSDYLYVGDGAQVNVNTFASGDAGTLTVNASDVEILGGYVDEDFNSLNSGLFAQADIGQTGKGGDINVKADYLLVGGGGQINVNTFGDGDAGDLLVNAKEIELIAGARFLGSSGLYASADFDSTGNGGNLVIDTESLSITNGAQAIAATFGAGAGGNLSVTARNIELSGTSPGGTASGLFTNAEFDSTGNGGNLVIDTESLSITDGAQAIAATFGAGAGGNLSVTARNIELSGTSERENPSGLFTVVEDGAGNGGTMKVTTKSLTVNDGAQIAVSTSGSGNAGDLEIIAETVNLTASSDSNSSGLFATAIVDSGNGGNLKITTDNLSIEEGATISASNFASRDTERPPGTGRAGNIEINSGSISLANTDSDIPSSISASTFSGGGGNIQLNVARFLTVDRNSEITAETKGTGNGGTVDVTANSIKFNNGGRLSTNTIDAGDGGAIAINTDNLQLNNNGVISSSSTETGRAGNINLNAFNIFSDRGKIVATSEQTGGGDIKIASESIRLQNDSLISTSVLDSNGGGGNITIDNSNLILARNNSDIRANAVFGPGGNINIFTELMFTDLTSEIDASSEFGLDGVVQIKSPQSDKELNTAILPENIEDPTGLISASCPISEDNSFAVTGNGGIPNSPYQTQSLSATWYDLRLVKQEKAKVASLPEPLKEATATMINAEGELELVALTPLSTHRWIKSGCSS